MFILVDLYMIIGGYDFLNILGIDKIWKWGYLFKILLYNIIFLFYRVRFLMNFEYWLVYYNIVKLFYVLFLEFKEG